MITEGYKANFETLKRAFIDRNVALLECTDVKTGRPVMVIVAVEHLGEEVGFVPFAKMFDGNPYEEINPPS